MEDPGVCFHCGLPAGKTPLLCSAAGALRPFCCQGCRLVYIITGGSGGHGESSLALARLVIGITCGMVVMIFTWSHYADLYLFRRSVAEPDALAAFVKVYVFLASSVVMTVLGVPILQAAAQGAKNFNIGVDTLIAAGCLSAYGASVLGSLRGKGETYYDTATMILIFVTLGRYLEARGRSRASEAIRGLERLIPRRARVLRENREIALPIDEISVGEKVIIRPGEDVPVDGVVLEGEGSVNEAPLTGEHRPSTKTPGDRILSGTISIDGAFIVSVAAVAKDRVIVKLARLADDARRERPAIVGITDRVARLFTVCVALLAIGAFGYWSLSVDWRSGLMISLSVLLIACPCALGVTTPLTFWTGLAVAARRGILIRTGSVLERLTKIRHVYFDKTGTLTQESFRLSRIDVETPAEGDPSARRLAMLEVAASLESRSNHPLAGALRRAALGVGLEQLPVAAWRALPGLGVRGQINGKEYFLGNLRLMQRTGLERRSQASGAGPTAEPGESMLYLGSEGTVNAAFAMIQQVRPEAAASLEGLRKMGISLAMLTGDDRSSAESLGRALKISDVRAGLTPEEKVLAIKDAQPTSQHVAMVGDGINDAAALAAADVGIAAGCGTDIAREAADVTIISEDLTQLPWLFYFARRVRRVMLTNLGWSFAYNIVGIGLALTGWLPPVLAAIAMVLSSAFVLGNTLLLLSERTKGSVAMVLFHAGSASQDGAEEKPRWAYV